MLMLTYHKEKYVITDISIPVNDDVIETKGTDFMRLFTAIWYYFLLYNLLINTKYIKKS